MQFHFQIIEEKKGCWVISLDHAFSSLKEANKGIDEISWALGIEPLPPVISSLDDAPSCLYCNGDCPKDEDHACDGYLGDIDNLYDQEEKPKT